MRFLNPQAAYHEMTYDDVFLVPQYSDINSRMEVDLTPSNNLGTNIPLVIANMNAVAGKRMAETVTRRGGLVILPQDMNWDRVQKTVQYIKGCHPVYESPIILSQDETIQTALNLIGKRAHGAVIVTDKEYRPVGIFTEKEARNHDRYTSLKRVMRTDVITEATSASAQDVFKTLDKNRIPLVPMVYPDGTLAGVMTKKGSVRSTIYKPAQNTEGHLLTATAVGINKKLEAVVGFMLTIGVDIIALDTAHGHQKRMVDAIRTVRKLIGPNRPLVAGNVVTGEATRDFIEAGANIVKVGVGPGAMCTTRMMTGTGRPQFSAVLECSRVARELGGSVWADGGARHPRDVAIALAAGASHVMVGSWFAGTHESVGDLMYDEQGRAYKENFGMASRRAVVDRNDAAALFEQAKREYFEEGISTSRMYLKAGAESAEDIIDSIMSGVRSACTYAGARSLGEFYDKSVVGIQTTAGYNEGKPVAQSW